jgi:hypothetical protein
VEIEVWGGKNSVINSVPRDQTAFVHRGSTFTFQLYASSAKPPYPQEGFDFVDGEQPLLKQTRVSLLKSFPGLANSITQNNPSEWNYGYEVFF